MRGKKTASNGRPKVTMPYTRTVNSQLETDYGRVGYQLVANLPCD